jgi:hypothetical protein
LLAKRLDENSIPAELLEPIGLRQQDGIVRSHLDENARSSAQEFADQLRLFLIAENGFCKKVRHHVHREQRGSVFGRCDADIHSTC